MSQTLRLTPSFLPPSKPATLSVRVAPLVWSRSPITVPDGVVGRKVPDLNAVPVVVSRSQLAMTSAEKASAGFYQLAGRRMNWDLTDYHPLLAQRAQSAYVSTTDTTTLNNSIGYSQATDIKHSSYFALRLTNPGATATSTAHATGQAGAK